MSSTLDQARTTRNITEKERVAHPPKKITRTAERKLNSNRLELNEPQLEHPRIDLYLYQSKLSTDWNFVSNLNDWEISTVVQLNFNILL